MKAHRRKLTPRAKLGADVEAPRARAAELEDLLDSVQAIVWRGNPETFQFTYVSKEAEILLGYPCERWTTEPTFWADHIHPEDRDWAVSFCAKATAEKRAHVFEYRMIAADGRVVWLRDSVRVIVENDRVKELIGVMVDVTERKRAEEEADRRKGQAEAMARLAQAVTASLELGEVLDRVARASIELLPDSSSRIWVVEGDRVVLRAEAGILGPPRAGRKTEFAIGEGMTGHVVTTRQPLLVDNVLAYPGAINVDWMRQEGYVSYAGIPLLVRDRLVGVLALLTRHRHRFSSEEIDILVSFGTQAAIAIENARLYREAREYGDHLKALEEVNRLVSSSLRMEEVVGNIAAAAARFFEAPQVRVWVLDPSGERFRRIVNEGDPAVAAGDVQELGIGEGGVGWVALHREPILWTDVEQDGRIVGRSWLLKHGLRYFTAYPLILGGRVLGALAMFRRAPYPMTPETQSFLNSLTAQAAVALENARLYTETSERLKETETLLAVGKVLSLNLPTPEAMRQVAREVAHAFGADMAGAYFLDARREALVPLAGYHVPKEHLKTFAETPFPLSRVPFLREAWQTRKPAWTSDYASDSRFDQEFLAGLRPGALLFAPTMMRGEIVGGLFLVWWAPGRTFSPGELRLIEGVASQVGLFLENADLARQTQEKLRETETLLSVSRALSSTLDLEPLLRHFLRHVARTLGADSAGVWLLESDTGQLEPFVGYRVPPHLLETLRACRIDPEESPFHADAIRERRVQVSSNVPEDPRISASYKAQMPHRSQLFAPIVTKHQVIGAIIAAWWERPREFSEREIALVEAMASQAAVALDNARLFQENQRKLEELAAAQEQLVRTEKLRALGEMASGVAHNFNNLLTPILGRTQLLLEAVTDPTSRKWLEMIERAAQDGAQTVTRIQEFTRVRHDRALEAVDLNEVVQQALEVTQPKWRDEPQSKGTAIEVMPSFARIPTVAGDPAELREALINLILNAVDAMPNGGTLALTTELRGDRVVLEVSDTGVGMSEEVQRRLFDPFFTTKGPRGTGLGLSMTYGIVSRHGGEITVESAEGQGSTFRLSFPPRLAAPASPEAAPSPAADPLRCLVVDDEPSVREVLGDLLKMRGHTPVLAGDGAEAIARFKAEPFDLVITDLAMAGLNGWDVAQAVKEHDPAVPVFLITGWAVEHSAEELKARGVDRVLSKPPKLADVLSALSACTPRGVTPEGC